MKNGEDLLYFSVLHFSVWRQKCNQLRYRALFCDYRSMENSGVRLSPS
jgi:hypothetical protein